MEKRSPEPVRGTNAISNAILSALSEGEYQRLAPHLTEVTLDKGQVMHEERQAPQSVYFLTEGIAVLSLSGARGKALQMSVIGSESIVGERAVFAGGLPLVRCYMVTKGNAYKLSPTALHDEFYGGGKLQDLVMRVIEARIVETSQNALCNHMHQVEQRLSRWLCSLRPGLLTPVSIVLSIPTDGARVCTPTHRLRLHCGYLSTPACGSMRQLCNYQK